MSWDFYTFKTHADITKQDGGKAQYDVYTEVVANGDSYQVVYAKIGEEEIFNDRARAITDQRILKMLGLEGQESAPEAKPSEEQPAEEAADQPAEETPAEEETVIAQRGDKNDTALSIQEMLIKLGYLDGGADGCGATYASLEDVREMMLLDDVVFWRRCDDGFYK